MSDRARGSGRGAQASGSAAGPVGEADGPRAAPGAPPPPTSTSTSAVHPGPSTERQALPKTLRALEYFTIAFGAAIGVGWIVVLGDWLELAGPLGAVTGLVIGGLLICFIGLAYAELATSFPATGGEVVYAYALFGLKPAFAVGWLLAMAYVAVTAFETIAVGWIVSALLPGLEGPVVVRDIGGVDVRLGGLLLGWGGLALLTFLNWRGTRSTARFQDWLTWGLIVASGAFIGAGLLWGDVANLRPGFATATGGAIWIGVVGILVQAPNWLGGFQFIPQMMEEKATETSYGAIGRVLVLSILVPVAFYSLVVVAASMVAPWPTLLDAELPAAAAFRALFGSELMVKLVLLAGVLGLVTTWNAVFMGASRVLYALGRARIIHPWFGALHPRHGSPARAVLFVAAIAALSPILGRAALLPLLTVVSLGAAAIYGATCLAMVAARRRMPDLERPYRAPGGAVTGGIGAAVSLGFVGLAVYQPWLAAGGSFPLEWALVLLWAALGAGFWLASRRLRESLPEAERRTIILGARRSA